MELILPSAASFALLFPSIFPYNARMTATPGDFEKAMVPPDNVDFNLAAALGAMQGDVSDDGLSLDDLNRNYAAMLGADDPYLETNPPPHWDAVGSGAADAANLLKSAQDAGISEPQAEAQPLDSEINDMCAIAPRTIWEAILFVGQPGNQPVRAGDVAKLMRGVTAIELDELVQDLNQTYEAENTPYRIASIGDGYRMELAPDSRIIEARMLGKAKQAKLSQSQVETLAIVAYHQPVTAKEMQERRGRPSGGILRQLVRRGLITIEPGEVRGQEKYRTTTRFLQVFQLKGLSDLPQVQDLDRSL
jgi:segregation and condensation protein B